jgi:hypothetical protein
MTIGAFALVRLADTDRLLPLVEEARASGEVAAWHAVDGHHHLVLSLAAPAGALLDRLRAADGIGELRVLSVRGDEPVPFSADPARTYAWIFVEAEEDAGSGVLEALASPDVAAVLVARTDEGVVAVLHGADYAEVDRLIEQRVRVLDGVARLKRDWIIDLTTI